ncbi:hypothetical protein [Flammeovirga kamogawensis]|uniref:Apea-like HEPN domain-containing protein n=1 Tax=Flammeovirga kamogawensis TaxID=373891 RepID=A0ABX8GU70_9BACT|nr:hypothetical protein [Flammeovirga kamogawensis]MBB6463331.1 hypothetical protein [Flammeovirga kamogawensis]QWG06697.1 hypothetical protein KM029_15475 [Flammeovirga kamogawensis]TRX68519.1 hypothetical protein EO216_10470 [Flammeovirga kamogawensis]
MKNEILESTLFVRYYENTKDKEPKEVTMSEIASLLEKESEKEKIAEYIYLRLYTRFLKLFDYETEDESFKREYKHGFLQMAACCMCIESLASFLEGTDRTEEIGKGHEAFNKVFNFAKNLDNKLLTFLSDNIYSSVRNAVLHQGETYKGFKITRKDGEKLYQKSTKTVNAHIFHKELVKLLKSYKKELVESSWSSEKWDNARRKIRSIIDNCEKK